MQKEIKIYTGKLMYRDIEFTFVFDKTELRLIPPSDSKRIIRSEWLMKSIAKGVYVEGEPLHVEEPYLKGRINENGRTIVFITQKNDTISSYNEILIVPIIAYIELNYERESIDRISFSSPEINGIFPVNRAIKIEHTMEDIMQGVYTVTTKSFDDTTSPKQQFNVDGKQVYVYFGITRGYSLSISESPIHISSAMMFEFEPTSDYLFIYRLWEIAQKFISFLCYRRNAWIPEVELSAPYEEGKHEKFATLYVLSQYGESEVKRIKEKRYIKQEHISGYEGRILSEIANDMLYIRHIPETDESGRQIDAAKFIMITAAFEWEFRQLFPEGIKKSEKTVEIEDQAEKAIQELIDLSSGKLKKKYRFLKKLIRSDSLQDEVIYTGNQLEKVIDVFGKRLYELNNGTLNYTEMGQRLADQRNHYAHGDLDKDFIGESLSDVVFMRYVVYAIQLSRFGIDEKSIQHAINELFRCGILIN